MLSLWSLSAGIGAAAAKEAELATAFLPEPGYLIAQTEGTPTGEETAIPQPQDSMDEERERAEKQRQTAEVTKWKNDRLRDFQNQIREITKARKQFARLKGSAEGIAKLDGLTTKAVECSKQLKAAKDSDDLKDLLEGDECGDSSETWDELNRLRMLVELPRDINNITKDLKRAQSQIKQKWVCKIVDCDRFKAVIANMETQLTEAKRLYQAGELEEAQELIRETFHEKGWFGDAMGAVQFMREITEPLRSIRNKDFKAEVEALLVPVKELLYEGEVRQARETMEEVRKELGPIVWQKIMQSEKRKQAMPDDILEKLEGLKQKFGGNEEPAPAPPMP
ncbi:MAG: hypothetical protein AAB568_02675 [Patescibacteria group bacterium]